MTPFNDQAVQKAFEAFPAAAQTGLFALREMIFAAAAETPGVGPLTETLKWGQPAYLTEATKSGSTIRLGVPKTGGYAIYAHCQTSIIPDFAAAFPDHVIESARGVHFAADDPPPDEIRFLIKSALTYHLRCSLWPSAPKPHIPARRRKCS